MKIQSIIIVITALFCVCIISRAKADVVIYNNSDLYPDSYQYNPGANVELLDYGKTFGSGANSTHFVSKFSFDYATLGETTGTIWVSFYRDTDEVRRGTKLSEFELTEVPTTSGERRTYEYIIPENQRFQLPPGKVGYSYKFENTTTRVYSAKGDSYNTRWWWRYKEGRWGNSYAANFDGGYFSMKIYKAEPTYENSADITGYVFNDLNANGIWDKSETGLAGCQVYVDLNGSNQYEPGIDHGCVTDSTGKYLFVNLGSWHSYRIRQVIKDGWNLTAPYNSYYYVQTRSVDVYGPYNFANTMSYCDAMGLDGSKASIQSVHIKDLGAFQEGTDGYYDFTDQSISLEKGTAYPLEIISYGDQCKVWIDWNGDKIFDDSEESISLQKRYFGDNPQYIDNWIPVWGSFSYVTPPANAVTGETRMRIRCIESKDDPILPCGVSDTGQVYDFSIYVTNLGESNEYRYGGGLGTAEHPYLISNAEHLKAVRDHNYHWGKYFKLTEDIDLERYKFESNTLIGSFKFPYTGVFDGNHHSVSNFLYKPFNARYGVGLFSQVDGPFAHIKDLTLINPEVDAPSSDIVGGLIGILSEGYVTDCHIVGGTILGDKYVGGLIGGTDAVVERCSSKADITGNRSVGGLIGILNRTTLSSSCVRDAIVTANISAGGLAGSVRMSTVSDCYSVAQVSGMDNYTSGLIGYVSCSGSFVNRCYAAGEVNSGVGHGFVGMVLQCNPSPSTMSVYGGYWDILVSGRPNSANGQGLNTDEMIQQSTYDATGWDFANIWRICDGENYPRLQWEARPVGDFVCPEGVEFNDLMVLCDQWLGDEDSLSADIAPQGEPDGTVDLFDYALFVENWLWGVD